MGVAYAKLGFGLDDVTDHVADMAPALRAVLVASFTRRMATLVEPRPRIRQHRGGARQRSANVERSTATIRAPCGA